MTTTALLLGFASAPAFADTTGATSATEETVATVTVTEGITLSTVPAISLTGLPGQTVTSASVPYSVTTNAASGYGVTVQAEADSLVADGVNNAEIPIGALRVNSTAAPTTFQALSDATPVTVHTQTEPSVANGDNLTNVYRMLIPAVPADAYTVTLDYVATLAGAI